MPGCVNQVKFVRFISNFVVKGNGMHLNGDASFPFKIHVIQHLITEFSLRNGTSHQQKLICQCAFAMINMGNNGEIANLAGVRHLANFHPMQRVNFISIITASRICMQP